ncbi:NAD(P)/FAD-dependent oxidoreductase [candidate division KSB1 bacterium]|nr:NAD(P)/FAD-dependent oxidoreductase [candidate division KSB1 bacterium]
MRLQIHQISLPLNYKFSDILPAVAKKLKCDIKLLDHLKIIKRSIDARPRNPAPMFSFTVEVNFNGEKLPKQVQPNDVQIIPDITKEPEIYPLIKITKDFKKPVIVGAGPAGLMAALVLAKSGLKPVIIERGTAVGERTDHVEKFWGRGILDPESNVLYGEGGAGLFSDGKLTARSKDKPRIRYFFETLVECGAPSHILIDSAPHLGTDILVKIVPQLRRKIESYGGTFRFNSRLSGFRIENDKIHGLLINDNEYIDTGACILATGHSARDVYELFFTYHIPLEPKPFAVGVRLELPQEQVNRSQWGKFADHPRLGAASFRLTRRGGGKYRACYSFCMCPGGTVISCASSPGEFTTNGMSLSGRAGLFANAGFLVPVLPGDFIKVYDTENPAKAGYLFQSDIEQKVFRAGGSNYSIPAERLGDFLSARKPSPLPGQRSWRHAVPADIHSLLPKFVNDTLVEAIPKMLKELNSAREDDVLLYAAETRSSCPVRMTRNAEDGQSTGVKGLYPAGEGSGYAGGIVSSAIDGMKTAEAVVRNFQ